MTSTRSYDATKRRARAEQTRRRIIVAARNLFTRQGYGATTIAEVADVADVSEQTIYKTFDTKRVLLHEVVAATVAGDDDHPSLLDQPWVDEVRDEPDPHRRLEMLVAGSRRIYQRTAAIQRVVAEAAAVDPDIAEMFAENRATRLAHQRELLRLVTDGGELLGDAVLDEAAEYMWAIMSPEIYGITVEHLGWPPDRWQAWITRTLQRVLLPPSSPGTRT